MKNRGLIVLSVFLLLVLASILGLSAYFTNYNTAIKANWGISLPRGYKESFSTDSGPSFLGDGDRYHVFNYKKGLKPRDMGKFNFGRNIELEADVEKIINSLQIPNQAKPDFSKEYYWYGKNDKDDPRDTLYIIYFMEENRVYVVEEFY